MPNFSQIKTSTQLGPNHFQKICIWLNKFFHLAIVAVLALQGLYTTYLSLYFLLIKHPQLEKDLISHLVTQDTVDFFISQAIINSGSAMLSLFLATVIYFTKNRFLKNLASAIGFIIFCLNVWLINNLSKVGGPQMIIGFIKNILD